MSAGPLVAVWEGSTVQAAWQIDRFRLKRKPAARAVVRPERRQPKPPANLALYRKHTESLLRRYLYASMQVGRAPSILSDPVSRGWASSRPVRSFEDAMIFVLDIERCLSKLNSLDRDILSRVVLQEYTFPEAAVLLGMSGRTICNRYPLAVDRLTEKVLESDLLVIPH
jgi:DNA-directed RNA polymerase specialized sigma24 family protein